MIRAIIFDCFGVLVGRGFDETYRSAGGDPEYDHDFVKSMLGKANLGLITPADFREEITRHLGITDEIWFEAIRQAEQPDHELLAYIEKLHKKYKTAILSNANKGVVQRKLGDECVNNCFDAVIISAEIGKTKPDPDIYKIAAERLDVRPDECIFVDDLEGYVKAAECVGMKGIQYKSFTQLKKELSVQLVQTM